MLIISSHRHSLQTGHSHWSVTPVKAMGVKVTQNGLCCSGGCKHAQQAPSQQQAMPQAGHHE
eukprot:NODE_5014_length_433_cov_27.869792_g4349_i0.p2 GENE.NODE_5014_length_433_cov_27.869792_g4349_i0~~NODE_5014_length_433_cov_27.869792_g4349_i0.p2  ORF type:complete len:62 (-),score=11.37 NODE_5014_length_433_cov_27.869792_g4349_i0:138-323(-)